MSPPTNKMQLRMVQLRSKLTHPPTNSILPLLKSSENMCLFPKHKIKQIYFIHIVEKEHEETKDC